MIHRVADDLLIYLGYALITSFLHWICEPDPRRWWPSLKFGFAFVTLMGVIMCGLYLLAIA